ncbi:glycosyltransferase family 2 protein [Tardiphaga alba]|uniref:Glycosyltransferase family 2 protein n=1 Tax=Tardiphaga alba TaxID=340268 RepID=A0ABX8A7W6_9BRAD|nr:glycosyltransferase [Tardiphaga alba]QUS38553.1 glycosyltransferase family 2 protein [Tardiphaga alba]
MTASREVAYSSAETGVTAVVCVPAFRRPEHLLRTLASVQAQRTSHRFAVVVVENDAGRTSISTALNFFESSKLPGACVVETQQGNCHAINAAFATAMAQFPNAEMLLMIDDDEIAAPDWLHRMIEAAISSDADVVGGPVFPQFDDVTKRDLSRHPAFCPAYMSSGPVPIIYGSGNCLIRRRVFTTLTQPTFDVRFNFLGGGDTDFFTRCRRAGLSFYWAAEAVITETVPPVRTQPGWIAARGLRIGAINYQIRAKVTRTSLDRIALLARVIATLPLSVWRAGRIALTERKLLIAMHPITVAVGGVLAAIGIEPQPYKAKSA